MNGGTTIAGVAGTMSPIERYYRVQAHIYDATRWSFLFGRTAILHDIALVDDPGRIFEAGCGTGKNLMNLCRRFPKAEISGVDLSEKMLELARRKASKYGAQVQLSRQAYGTQRSAGGKYDLILFSYALSMFNPGFEEAIKTAHHDLAPGGHIAVVDFHDTGSVAFKRWMGVNHVRMEGQLRPKLLEHFRPRADRLHRAYGGIWRYMMFVGQRI